MFLSFPITDSNNITLSFRKGILMCQSVRDGGRRCPVHRHTSHAVITATVHGTSLNRTQTERLFAELRREGRNARRLSERQRNNLRASVLEAVEGNETVTNNVQNQLALGEEHDTDLDGATGYALRLLQSRAAGRSAALDARFAEIAQANGLTVEQVENNYENLLADGARERGSEYPPEYNQNTRRRAVLANLPYDVASVVALERLATIGQAEQRRRVQLIEAPGASHLHAYGYDNGRLEVTFSNAPETVYAYNNVPEDVWERLRTASRPGSVYARSIRGNRDYFYESAEAAETDAYATRCLSCGQFASASAGHTCPPRARREELENANVAPAQIQQELINTATTTEELEAAEAEVTVPTETVRIENEVTILPADETEAEAEAEPPVEESAPQVIAAAHITPETFHFTDRTPTDIGDAEYPGFIGAEIYASMAPTEPTPEEQLNPTGIDTADYVVFESNNLSNVALVSKNSLYRLDPSYQHMQISDEERAMIANAPDDIYFVVARDSDSENNSPVRIISSYDSALFTGGTTREWVNGSSIRTVRISRRGVAVTSDGADESSEERQEKRTAAQEAVNALVDSGDAVRVSSVSSMTRRFRFDGTLQGNNQPRIATGRVTEMRRAFRDNKAIVVPVRIEQGSYAVSGVGDNSQRVDDQGYSVNCSQNYQITGDVALRRGANGGVEVISSQRTLKCSCYEYRRNYYCEHLNYANRHISNVVAQQVLMPVAGTNSEQFARGGLLTAALARREDLSVVEATTTENNEEVPAYISFGEELTGSRATTYENRWDTSSRLVAPSHLRGLTEPTFNQLREMSELVALRQRVGSLRVPVQPGALRQALKRGDTEVPLQAEFGRDGTVTGSIIYKKTDDIDNAEVRERKLKCTCSDYAENYDCKHVRFVAGQPNFILNAKARNGDPAEENSFTSMYNQHIDRIRQEEEVIAMMRDNPRMRESTARRRVEAERAAEEERRRRAEEERRRAIEREQAQRIERARAQAERINRENASYVAATDTYRANMTERWNDVQGELYSDTNNNKFYEDYRAALARKAAGEEPLPFRTENVTDGICAPVEGARRFGVEIEFDIQQGVNQRQALEKIGRELQEAGLTSSSYQRGYHSAAASGWSEWSFENDCTVAGEIVSPIMSDTPEHWEQLRKVCEIVNRNGGVASTRAGSHVHISTGSYGLSTAKHAELVRQTNQNEDVLYRMASNPSRGRHRGTQWCAPNANDNHGDISPELMEGHNVLGNVRGNNHNAGMNFGGASSSQYARNHVEFRMWDGSIDPAVIQQQVVMSAGLADLAERRVIENNGSAFPTEERRRIGNRRSAERALIGDRGTHTPETFREINQNAAEFIDSIVRTPQQREDLASLFAITKWQSN